MRRRAFIILLGGAAVVWPVHGWTQEERMPVIGFMSARSPDDSAHLVHAFQQGIADDGFVDGQNVRVDFGGRAENMIGCPRWPQIWFGGR
jgi:hypothetical protein